MFILYPFIHTYIGDNESECSDGMEYALRAKARLEKAEYLEVAHTVWIKLNV